jgi:hypothetical protein
MQNKLEAALLGIVVATTGCAAHVGPVSGSESQSLVAASLVPSSRPCSPDVIDASFAGGHGGIQGGYHFNVTLTHKKAGVTVKGVQGTVTFTGVKPWNKKAKVKVQTYQTWMNSEGFRADLAMFEPSNGPYAVDWSVRIFVQDDPSQLDACELVKTGVF